MQLVLLHWQSKLKIPWIGFFICMLIAGFILALTNIAYEVASRGDLQSILLEYDTWSSWKRHELSGRKKDVLDTNLHELNEQLEILGRPFGHRVYQAIFSYAANHPDAEEANSENRSLSEMLTMRILPKLRGIEIGASEQRAVNKIAALVRTKLDDEALADGIKASLGGDGMFTWTG